MFNLVFFWRFFFICGDVVVLCVYEGGVFSYDFIFGGGDFSGAVFFVVCMCEYGFLCVCVGILWMLFIFGLCGVFWIVVVVEYECGDGFVDGVESSFSFE